MEHDHEILSSGMAGLEGPIVGHSVAMPVRRVLHVVPSVYGRVSITRRYSVARTIGS